LRYNQSLLSVAAKIGVSLMSTYNRFPLERHHRRQQKFDWLRLICCLARPAANERAIAVPL